ncbi:hypothetical protein APHAL10511_002904 [Amanita phalloides]|nr:hypothetical protein APHAL10511_002904 [Amanita phalloides]
MRLLVVYISLLLLVTGGQAAATDTATDTATDKVEEFVEPVMRVNKEATPVVTELDVAPCTASVVGLVAVVVIISGALYLDTAVVMANSPAASDVADPARTVAGVVLVALVVTTAWSESMAGLVAAVMGMFAAVEGKR